MSSYGYSIELPNQSRLLELGFEEHARRYSIGTKAFSNISIQNDSTQTCSLDERYHMSKTISQIEQEQIDAMLLKANLAMSKIKNWNQQELDRLAQAIGWYSANEKTFTKLAQMGVDESGIGDRDGRPAKRFKIHGV